MDDDEAFLKEWAKTRQRGFWRFAFGRTLAMIAICMGIIAFEMMRSSGIGGGLFLAALIIAVITLVRMPFKWRAAEARYRQLTAKTAARVFE